MVVKSSNGVVASPSPNNTFAQYKSSFPTQSGKAPIRLRRNAPTKAGTYRSSRSVRSTRTEERVDVEAYDPFKDEREDTEEDSRSLFSEENSRDLWPPMPVSTVPTQDDDDFLPDETGPTGTPKRKKTGSTPFKPPKPSDGDDDGFTDGFRVSYSSLSSNFTNSQQSQPYDEFRASSTPNRTSKPSVLSKYKPSGGGTNDGFRAAYSPPTTPKRMSHSSVSSSKNGTNEAERGNGFRSSFSSAFTPQRGARLSIGSTHSTQTANDNGSVTSASQRSIKSTVSNKYTTRVSQASEKSNISKVVITPLRSKKSSVSNRYLSAVASKGQDDSSKAIPAVFPKVVVAAQVEAEPKVEEQEKVELPAKTEPEKTRSPKRSSSFSSAQKMWLPKEQPKMEEPEKAAVPAKKVPERARAPRRSFSDASKIWIPKEQSKMEEPEKTEMPVKNEPEKARIPRSASSSSTNMWLPKEQPKKTFVPSYVKNSTQEAEDDIKKIIEAKVAAEISKMKIQFDEEVQRIEERMEQKYMERIEALESKSDKMNKIIGKMISKRKSMDPLDMDRLEV